MAGANRRTALDPFAAAAIRLLILTGARLREILNLQWEHVDLERGLLLLPRADLNRPWRQPRMRDELDLLRGIAPPEDDEE